MERSVIRTVEPRHEVIEWGDINLSATPSDILWQTVSCTPSGNALAAIRQELFTRGEL